jgi:DNA-binding response OmpR family regulator
LLKILIADDEKKLCETMEDFLSSKGLSVVSVFDGLSAVERAENEAFDLIILDVMMPGLNGIEACKRIREFSEAPVMFLSALGEEENLLAGYKSGCDDYIVKPFPLSVLYEKVLSLVKRYKGFDSDCKLTHGNITLDLLSRSVFVENKKIRLSAKDFDILALLMQNEGKVLGREQILVKVWGYGYEGDSRAIDTHIKRIRKALGKENAEKIKTSVGVGYFFKEN